jgi:hypothetical protein
MSPSAGDPEIQARGAETKTPETKTPAAFGPRANFQYIGNPPNAQWPEDFLFPAIPDAVMPALVAGIHVFLPGRWTSKPWMAGTRACTHKAGASPE